MKVKGFLFNGVIYVVMIGMMGKVEYVNDVMDFFLEMKVMGFVFDVICYSSFINMFGKIG